MSSILDALKKAERESTVGGGMGSQWPTLPADSADDSQRRRRRWIWGVAITAVCTIVFIAWWMRRPVADEPLVVAKQAVEPAAAETPRSVAPPAPQVPPAPRREAREAAAVPVTQPSASKPLLAAAPQAPAPPPLPQPAPEPEEMPAANLLPLPQPAPPPTEAPPRRPAQTVQAPEPTEKSLPEMKKVFRSDARIDLQALVWAPVAADRFVVINNALLKEGGSIDNIRVVRINPDDVLLAEGGDQWYQEFKIR